MAKKKDSIDEFAEDLMVLMKRYKPSGVIILLGIPTKKTVRQAAFVAGDPTYLRELVNECCTNFPEFHNIIDDISGDHVEVIEPLAFGMMPIKRGKVN